MRSFLTGLIDIFYPIRCGACGRLGAALCKECIDSFQPVNDTITCPICGRITGSNLVCGACIDTKQTFKRGCFGYHFEGRLRDAIHAFKFEGRRDTGRHLVRLMEPKLNALAESFDCIIPLPVTERRLWQRGFNQTFIIAEEIARITGKDVIPDVLVKTKNTKDQYILSKPERLKNIRGVFTARNCHAIQKKRVLLVDDLYTTGNTAHEASRVLLRNSVKDVIFCAIARTPL